MNWQAAAGIVANNNSNSDNWYFTRCINMSCEKELWNNKGEFSPRILIDNTHPWTIPFLCKYETPISSVKNILHEFIKNCISNDTYIYFNGADDYYIEGKQGYLFNHFAHDGLITGVDNIMNKYTVFAYDIKKQLRTFKVSKNSIEKAFFSQFVERDWKLLLLFCKQDENVDYDFSVFKNNLENYYYSKHVNSNNNDMLFYGINVIKHLHYYVDVFYKDKMDPSLFDLRVFLSLYENKLCIYNSLIKKTNMDKCENFVSVCDNYYRIVNYAERIKNLSIKFSLTNDYNVLKHICININCLLNLEKDVLPQILVLK